MRARGRVRLPAADTVLARAITGPASVRPTPGPPHPGPRQALSDSRAMEGVVDTAVIGAGAAGLFTALVAAEQGARVALVSRSPSRSPRATGPRAGWPPRSGPTTRSRCTSRTPHCRARHVPHGSRQILCREAPDRVRDLEQRGIAFDRSRTARCTCRWRAATTGAGWSTPAAARPAAT